MGESGPLARGTLVLGMAALVGLLGVPVLSAQSTECARWRRAFIEMATVPLEIVTAGRRFSLRAKRAETPEHRAAGFQCATPDEIMDHLILFDFGQEVLTPFHMNNVPASLDIAFAKADGRIFVILQMEPSPTRLYSPPGAFRYALEARAGFFEPRGIAAGTARLVVPGGH